MYNYELYISGYDGAIRVFLQNEKLYTDTQFKDLVTDVFVSVIKEKLKEFPEEEPIKELWGEDIFTEVYESLAANYGFKEPVYTADFSMIGYANFLNKDENTFDEMVELIKTKL
jgi:hypothetical protein